ncbi:hypothetical protein [Chitinophaga deserti]|uniref:hypothetical protein n=1 Tax=Chitinophaga deserti TaxID=2164099 RepID=UPI0013007669|nr:hypothetical protein [Chitinophaga deserti]
MKYISLILISVMFLFACKTKTIIEEVIIPLPPGDLDFRITKLNSELSINFQWNQFPAHQFSRYEIIREHLEFRNGNFVPIRHNLKTFNRYDSISYSDDNVPFSSKVSYYLTAYAGAGNILRDTVHYVPTQTFYTDYIRDVIMDNERHVLYLVGYSKWTQLTVYDHVGKKVIKTVEMPANGFIDYNPDAGTSGELYVGTFDGWLLILDPITLEQKNKIYVMGNQVLGVQEMNGMLIVCTTDYTTTPEVEGYRKATKVYRRSTGELLNYIGHTGNARMLKLGNNRLLEVMPSVGPTSAYSILLDENGQVVNEKWAYGPFQTEILRVFPSGGRFISGTEGKIYNSQLEQLDVLGVTDQFADFAINEDGTIIYAADNITSSVKAIRLSDKQVLKSYPYKALLYGVYLDGDRLMMISSYYQDPVHRGTPPFIFESVKL